GPDYAPGNSVCSVGAITGGPCSLRAALTEAYLNLAGQDIIINLDSETYLLTIPPDTANDIHSGDLDIPDNGSVYSITVGTNDPLNRAVIDGNQLDRVFRIGEGVNINLANLVVRGGLLLVSTGTFSGGAGILNDGNLHLDNVIIEDNEARCQEEGCSINIIGGAVLNYGDITMRDSTIQNNLCKNYSAIFNTAPDGNVVILNSTIANNHAINVWTIGNYSTMHIRNTTISDNTSGNTELNYAGIINYDPAYLVVESSTFANAGRYASIFNHGNVRIKDSIFMALPAQFASNCFNDGTWTSMGYNIFSDEPYNVLPAAGDYFDTDPLLSFLGSWGGPTKTRALKPGSPAIDHRPDDCDTIPFSPLIPPETLTIDQRYFDRNDGKCDTGAFEGSLEISDIFLPLFVK
ncbi:MAG: choice-of-anchor Q domain-containing protein, partial [Brevefilum sp.]